MIGRDLQEKHARYDHFLRLLGEHHGFFRTDYGFAVKWQRRQRAGFAARGDDDGFAFKNFCGAVGRFHADFPLALEGAEAADVIHLVLLEKELDAARELIGHLARAPDHRAPIIGKPLDREAELARLVHERLVELGVFKERLGGDATPVQAGAARAIRFDAGYFFPVLGGADGGDVSGGAATDDNEIVGHDIFWKSGSRRAWFAARRLSKGERRLRSCFKPKQGNLEVPVITAILRLAANAEPVRRIRSLPRLEPLGRSCGMLCWHSTIRCTVSRVSGNSLGESSTQSNTVQHQSLKQPKSPSSYRLDCSWPMCLPPAFGSEKTGTRSTQSL